MSRDPAVAVIDIGKSNAKLALVDQATRGVVAVRTTANAVVNDGPYPHYDVERLWGWIIGGLVAFARDAEITAISVTTHGACFALLTGDQLALPVLDYEFTGPETVRGAYAKARGDFAETLSPDLPNGLNAGRQIYWQSRTYPSEFAKADAILPYPQYWAWRLTGAKVAERTSLGCHTDLWNPDSGTYSRLAVTKGWDKLFPPLVKPWDTVGTILLDVARATGLAPTTRVVAGIHDSNASLLPHLLSRSQPFAVLSTGTWMVVFAPGGSLNGLDPKRDCLANVDAYGHAVPSSRFMAGREFEMIAGGAGDPTAEAVERTIANRTMALPTFAPGTGPFGASEGRWVHKGTALADPSTLALPTRSAAASLYAALVTEACLELAGAQGSVIVEGPFAKNALFLSMLAQRVPRAVIGWPGATGTTDGAALLAAGLNAKPTRLADPSPVTPLEIDLSAYAVEWSDLVRVL
jgi:sugar (pentulose or hexulose) kinase